MWLERLKLITNEKIISKLAEKHVLILGLGGVGSYAAEAIVRSGVGTVTIIDNDIIDITNLNRQLMTNTLNVGLNKTDVLFERLKLINPNVIVNKINLTILPDNIDIIFNNNPDFIIDACDTLITKKELIRKSKKYNVKLISSMGMANKFDPTKIEIIDIRKTSYDPLAKIIRKMVNDEKIKGKVTVVSSTEKPALNQSKTLGSTSFVPSTSGLFCASHVINSFIKEIEADYE